jgi:hypothetical protein
MMIRSELSHPKSATPALPGTISYEFLRAGDACQLVSLAFIFMSFELMPL